MIGAKIGEFPTSVSAARLARAVEDPVIMAAPNIARGGSQARNVSACEPIEGGHCDALVSDYHDPSLARAPFTLTDQEPLPRPRARAMISETPARILKLTDRGRLDFGARADLAIINMATREVEATISGGRITHLSGEAATRFLTNAHALRLAADRGGPVSRIFADLSRVRHRRVSDRVQALHIQEYHFSTKRGGHRLPPLFMRCRAWRRSEIWRQCKRCAVSAAARASMPAVVALDQTAAQNRPLWVWA